MLLTANSTDFFGDFLSLIELEFVRQTFCVDIRKSVKDFTPSSTHFSTSICDENRFEKDGAVGCRRMHDLEKESEARQLRKGKEQYNREL